MVSFQCEGCGDIVKKPKCKIHQQRCHAPFTCIDCHQTFPGSSYQPHNQCMTESEKYEKGYKAPKNKQQPKKTTSTSAQPDSIIAQLEKKKEQIKRPLEEEDQQEETNTKENKKAKKEKKEKKEKKTKSLLEWSTTELDTDKNKQIVLALEYILKKDQTTLSVEELRNKVTSMIISHPKVPKDMKKEDYNALFDQTVGLSFNSKKKKVVFSSLKK
ncbi:uncharacterized protein BX664DRAFT_13986 [Halteromyces radiatus]|uniref:uncharacterized protein n=1 Tax=Halteromyces radiatus TaxID=101107 RepID=UPI002220633C|nr:uncharacterized protein BX664DRAFT_13986 [Halteromyces radiatus]KAI8099151.1 hypothetical protein BX664DRAFT_13986 [Halteromyces radiatus]